MLIFLLCENSIAYQVLHTPTHYCCVGVAHPDPGSGGGVLLLSRDTRLKHYFYFVFVFVHDTRFCVLWLESLILAQDERWRRA